MFFSSTPLERTPIPAADIPFLNRCYLHTVNDRSDPTLVWGSEVDMTGLHSFLAQRNNAGSTLLTTTPVLIRAVGLALAKHHDFNRRVLGEKIYRFSEVNVLVPVQRSQAGPSLSLFRQVDQRSYDELFQSLWTEQRGASQVNRACDRSEYILRRLPTMLAHLLLRGWLWAANHLPKPMGPLDRPLRGAPVMVNHFGFPGAPPLNSYKASRFGSHCTLLNVTLGPTMRRPLVIGDKIVIRPMAGLFVRADHRTIDAYQLSNFVATIVEILTQPEKYDAASGKHEADGSPGTANRPRFEQELQAV